METKKIKVIAREIITDIHFWEQKQNNSSEYISKQGWTKIGGSLFLGYCEGRIDSYKKIITLLGVSSTKEKQQHKSSSLPDITEDPVEHIEKVLAKLSRKNQQKESKQK